ncbi:MAG TPA: ATP-binding protein [Gemmatimonadaceae bacterium]|nr:ATP-binding protein [Gemmatimonadaceae bacterium]
MDDDPQAVHEGRRDARPITPAAAAGAYAAFRDVVLRAPAAIAILRGPDHVMEFVNEMYRRVFGDREYVGRPVRDVFPEVESQGFVALLDGVYRTGVPYAGTEIRLCWDRDGDGTEQEGFFNLVYQPILDAEGRPDGVLAFAVDVTALVRARREAEALARELEQANAAKSEFLATMSHEIRTPINAIVGYTDLLDLGIAGPVTEAQHAYLSRLRSSSAHLQTLVDDVLDLARIDAGQATVIHEQTHTGEAVAAALALVFPQAEAQGVRLVDPRSGERGVPYVGDPQRVRQILVNLLSNAIKFTPRGGVITVECGLAPEAPPAARLAGGGPWAYVTVQDTGIGIAPEHQAAVFEPFHQVEAGRTRTTGGTGLGLAISRRLARLMGGDLTVASQPGEGSTFTLWLPAPRVTGEPESARARGARASGGFAGYRVHGLAEVGAHLRANAERVLDAFVVRLRSELPVPELARLERSLLEDHGTSMLTSLAESLVILERTGGVESRMLDDGGEILRVIAQLHGRQRCRLGWTEAALAREYEILDEEIAALVRRQLPEDRGDATTALEVLRRLVSRAATTSARAFRQEVARMAEADG